MSSGLLAPRLDHEDHTKDVDFTPTGIRKRGAAGYANARRAIELAPWRREFGPLDGVILHEPEGAARSQEVLGDTTAATPRDYVA
jgi:NTE family protein